MAKKDATFRHVDTGDPVHMGLVMAIGQAIQDFGESHGLSPGKVHYAAAHWLACVQCRAFHEDERPALEAMHRPEVYAILSKIADACGATKPEDSN